MAATSPTTWRILACISAMRRLSSGEPVSTMTSRSRGRVWSESASRHSLSHAPPSWTTKTPVTKTGRGAARTMAFARSAESPVFKLSGEGDVTGSRTAPGDPPLRLPAKPPQGLDDILLELATFSLGKPTPDAEPLVVLERILQALAAHFAAHADFLGIARGAALLREERLGISLSAQGAFLPGQCILGGVDQLDAHDQL